MFQFQTFQDHPGRPNTGIGPLMTGIHGQIEARKTNDESRVEKRMMIMFLRLLLSFF